MEQLKQQPETGSNVIESEISVKQFCQKMGFVAEDLKTRLFVERMYRDKLMSRYFNMIIDHVQLSPQADLVRQKALFAILKKGSFLFDAPSRYCVKSIEDLKRHETYSKLICKKQVIEELKNKPLQYEIASLKIKYNAKQVEYDAFLNHFFSVNELNYSLISTRDKMKALGILLKKFSYCCKVLTGQAPGSVAYRNDVIGNFKDYENDIITDFGCDVEAFVKFPKNCIFDKLKVLGETTLNTSNILLTRIHKVDFTLDHLYDELLREGSENDPVGCEVAEMLMIDATTLTEKMKSIVEQSKTYRNHSQQQFREIWESNKNEKNSTISTLTIESGRFVDCVETLSKSVDRLQVILTSSDEGPVVNDGKQILDDINNILSKYGTSITSPDSLATIRDAVNRNENISNEIAKFKKMLLDINWQTTNNVTIDFKNYTDVVDNFECLVNLIIDGYNKIDSTMQRSRKVVIKGSFNFHEINGTAMDAFIERLRKVLSEHEILSVMPI